MKRIATQAYEALRDALPTITWNKTPFESFLRTALRDHPELLARLEFKSPKRETANLLVNQLIANENEYQEATLVLMLEVAQMEQFPNIEQMKDAEDRALRLQQAREAVGRLRTLTKTYSEYVTARSQTEIAREAYAAQQAGIKQFADDIDQLRTRYLSLHSATDPHRRGKEFETLLSDLFLLFDMEPRLSYSLQNEQIDGSLSFDTDDYIVEAKWRADPTSRGDLDIFAKKVERKGRNALGIFISEKGFSAPALTTYRESSPFVVFTGEDLYFVLERRVRLDDLLKAKKRHVNETGNCLLAARDFIT
ncbi:restriction endonuclease [Rhodococcus ruber]